MGVRTTTQAVLLVLAIGAGALVVQTKQADDFRFAILGDRTGEAVPGVYREAWKEANGDRPDFIINVGDTVQGGNDRTVDSEWQAAKKLVGAYSHRYRIFFTPGNHDVWSDSSARAYQKYTGRPLHYSFDYGQAHFTILDNSRTESLPDEELIFLRRDLEAHKGQPLKFVFFHRPSWIIPVVLKNPEFPLHRLALQYGVRYVICGHIHAMLAFELDGVSYLSMASSGGHLRDPKTYEQGWFFQHTLVTVRGSKADVVIKELNSPFGQAKVSKPEDWSATGCNIRALAEAAK